MDMRTVLVTAGLALCACRGRDAAGPSPGQVTVYAAASLAAPLRSFATAYGKQTGTVSAIEIGGSLEHARKMTELGRTPDVLVLADYEVLASLMPKYLSWYAAFANNRMVIAYTSRSRFASTITPQDWPDVLTRRGVTIGRPDPSVAPAGYRALLMLQLAESTYHRPGLAAAVLANAGPRFVRPNAAELAALLDAGEVDYIMDYESVARAHGFQYVTLPPSIDLSDAAHTRDYARATVRVRGAHGDSTTMHGTPILYALAIPINAPHRAAAEHWVAALLSAMGRAPLESAFVHVLPQPAIVGSGAPGVLAQLDAH